MYDLNGQRGNLLLTISFLLLISAGVGGFLLNTKKVSEAIQSLDTIQIQTVLKSDIEKNIKKVLENNPGSGCPASVALEIKNKFTDFSVSQMESLSKDLQFSDGGQAFNNIYVACLISPGKFGFPDGAIKLDIRHMKIEMRKGNVLNVANFYVDIISNITVGIKTEQGGITQFRYNIKHRIMPKSLENYGLTFTHYKGNIPLFLSSSPLKIKVYAKTFVFVNNPSSTQIHLKHFTDKAGAEAIFYRSVEIEGTKFIVDNLYADQLNNGELSIQDIFTNGVIFDSLGEMGEKPWGPTYQSAYQEKYWYQFINSAYILPELPPGKKATIRKGSDFLFYGKDEAGGTLSVTTHNTGSIYENIFPAEGKEAVSKSCGKGNPTSGVFSPITFNNLNQEFVIDFSDNNTADYPPYFCGTIAAKKIKIILNTTNDALFAKHYLMGKFLVKEQIEVVGAAGKELYIIDSNQIEPNILTYALPDQSSGESVEDISRQIYMQKYYQNQNFFVPFFKTFPSTANAHFYLPRTLASFFDVTATLCGGAPAGSVCRKGSIETPELADVLELKDNLYFEVENLE